MIVLFEDEVLKISSRLNDPVPDGRSTILSFTGVGHGMGGVDIQKAEFYGAGKGFDNSVFITDKTRSWGNLLDFDEISERIAPFITQVDVFGIGNSMGGFLSVAMSKHIQMKAVVSFVPQFSVDPKVVPWEHRWADYRAAIEHYRISDLSHSFDDTTQYFVLSGGSGLDRRHAKMFPVRKNIHHWMFPKVNHGLAAHLKEAGVLSSLLKDAFQGSIDVSTVGQENVEVLSP